jgi:carboxypeptidase Taq
MSSPHAQLEQIFTRLYRYQHLMAMAGWDRSTMMPPKGNEARAKALAELDVLMHRTLTDPALDELFAGAEAQTCDEEAAASLREMRRVWLMASRLPESLVEARSLAGARCEHDWRRQRAANDWSGFLANFEEVVRLAREEATRLADATGLGRYESLIDKYEPGVRCEQLDAIFTDIKRWLPGLIARVRERQAGDPPQRPQGPFSIERQRELGLIMMRRLGFDFDAGRLDLSVHPFCGGVAEDVRITTRYRDDDFMQSLMGIIHETGHARYEQGLPRARVHLPVGQARSMGVHESQSLSFEMQLGRHPGLLAQLSPLLNEHFGVSPLFEPDNLIKLFTRVEPGLIRVDADELCYPAHVILRYEIERGLIEGDVDCRDVPAMWDEKMRDYLGLDTRGNFRDGCLQDIHWTDGSFGYFPSYTLGAMYAAQYFAAMRRERPLLDADIAAGELEPVFAWLGQHIWSQGSRWTTDELITRATGSPLDPTHYRAHLEARYLG